MSDPHDLTARREKARAVIRTLNGILGNDPETGVPIAVSKGVCTCGHPVVGHLSDGVCRLCNCLKPTPFATQQENQ